MQAVQLFIDMDTQWRRGGMSGARSGMDYTALPLVFDIRGIPKKQRAQMFDDLRVMEVAALDFLNTK